MTRGSCLTHVDGICSTPFRTVRFPKACECLEKDREVLFTFYDFPAAHWQHLRTTNPIKSTFATVRHRTRQTKGCGSRMATLTMVFKLARSAEKKWRRLNGYQYVMKVLAGIRLVDGTEENEESIAAARQALHQAVWIYNNLRPHLALDYKKPAHVHAA